jgi:hypothetical protein
MPTSSFQAILVRSKPTSSIPSYSSQAKTDLLHSRPFYRPKPISSIPCQYSQAITDFFYTKLFQLGQHRFAPVKAIPVRTKPTSSQSQSSQSKTNFLHSKPFNSEQYCKYIFPPFFALLQLVTKLFSSCLVMRDQTF